MTADDAIPEDEQSFDVLLDGEVQFSIIGPLSDALFEACTLAGCLEGDDHIVTVRPTRQLPEIERRP